MRVGESLLELARSGGRRSLFVVGTAKNVGKTVAMRAVAGAAVRRGLRLGLTSIGRDGEAVDAAGAHTKPRICVEPGALLATARNLLPEHPASEVVDFTPWRSAAGEIVLVRVRHAAHYELAGPGSAAGVRSCVAHLHALGCEQIIVDGALDRVAALAGGGDAVIVATGAGAASSMEEAVEDARALASRLRVPGVDPARDLLRIEGALTPALAARLAAARERRQVVVRDPTQIALSGKALLGALSRLDLRCDRPLHVVAATIASIGPERYFEPRAFLEAVASATSLPTFDVYAGGRAA